MPAATAALEISRLNSSMPTMDDLFLLAGEKQAGRSTKGRSNLRSRRAAGAGGGRLPFQHREHGVDGRPHRLSAAQPDDPCLARPFEQTAMGVFLPSRRIWNLKTLSSRSLHAGA